MPKKKTLVQIYNKQELLPALNNNLTALVSNPRQILKLLLLTFEEISPNIIQLSIKQNFRWMHIKGSTIDLSKHALYIKKFFNCTKNRNIVLSKISLLCIPAMIFVMN